MPGARNAQQMREDAGAGDVTLPPEDLAKVAVLWRSGFAAS
ncbi:MAG: aldo/keto reductase, partial [Deltaproteobacteria bacterium]|nr:aldo/keto reductase [Deltaproteobacteria bacterium]